MRFFPPLIPFSFLAIPCLLTAAHAQTYSWKDASGKVHYGDRPPLEKQVQIRTLEKAPPEPDDAANQRAAMAKRQFDERERQAKQQTEAGKAARVTVQEKEQAQSCNVARAALAGLESGHIRFGVNKKGERVALDGLSRDAEIKRAKMSVGKACSPPPKK